MNFNKPFTRQLDTLSGVFKKTLKTIDREYVEKSSHKHNAITGYSDFVPVFEAAKELYQTEFEDLWAAYIPVYSTVWRQDLQKPLLNDNLHQDEGVYHFGTNGYHSRMVNLWICLQKNLPTKYNDDELGIYVVEQGTPCNDQLYAKLAAAGTHFNLTRPGQLVDNTHLGGSVVTLASGQYLTASYPYSVGTAIAFSSHLLHGTKRAASAKLVEETGFRTALTSVWIHAEDFEHSVLSLPRERYADLYLRGHSPEVREELVKYFPEQCRLHELALYSMCTLARYHISLHRGT